MLGEMKDLDYDKLSDLEKVALFFLIHYGSSCTRNNKTSEQISKSFFKNEVFGNSIMPLGLIFHKNQLKIMNGLTDHDIKKLDEEISKFTQEEFNKAKIRMENNHK